MRNKLDIVVDKSIAAIDERLMKRETRWRAILTVVIAGLAFFGYTSISSFFDGISQAQREVKDAQGAFEKQINERIAAFESNTKLTIQAQVENEVKIKGVDYFSAVINEQLEGQRVELRNEISFAQFIDLADQLDKADSVSTQDLDLAEELLKQFSNDEKYINRPQYIIAISDYIGAVFGIDDMRRIRDAEKIIRSSIVTKSNPTALLAASTIATSFGIRICGAAIPREEDIDVFNIYFDHVSDNKFELPILI